jgi:predicted O-methyltransferase YrrM
MNEQELNPGELLEMSGKYWATCTLHAGVKLDVFSAIGEKRLTSGEVSEKISTDERATAMLLNALTAMNLLQKKGNAFTNTEISNTFLSKASPRYIGYMIMHHHHLVEGWSRLDQAVKTGSSVRSRASFSDEEMREGFIMGMFNMAMSIAPRLVPLIDLSSRHHLLDLGGGPGTYAIHFCLTNPNLKATIFDLPTTRPFAEETIKKFNLSDRIAFMPGDYVEEEVRGSYDAAWLSHILHGEGPETCRQIIKKTVRTLNPEGLLVVHDFILNDSMDSPLFPALFALNMLIGTDDGQAYSAEQIIDMLADAGLKDIQRIPFKSPNDSGLITGIVS